MPYAPYAGPFALRYQLSATNDVQLSIFNLNGQLVQTLVMGQQSAGQHVVEWDGRDGAGQQVSSGVYLYRLKAGTQVFTRRMVLMK